MPRLVSRRGGRGGRRGRGGGVVRGAAGRIAAKRQSTHRGRGTSRRIVTRRTTRPSTSNNDEAKVEKALNLDVNKDASEFFTKNASFDQHFDAQSSNKDKYLATLMAFEEFSIEVISNAKARSLAAAFARHDTQLVDFFLNHHKQYGFVDLLKAVTILDSAREKKSVEKKIERVAKCGSVMKAKKLGKLKNDINNLEKMKPKIGSCSGALAKQIRCWVRKFKETDLEFFALHMPTEPWKKLANIVHFNPSKDFPNAPWFLPYCFGKEAPKDSKLDKCKKISKENVNELLEEFNDLPYSFLKKYAKFLNEKSKLLVAERQEKLDTILWYYEDLNCDGVDEVIRKRLERGDQLELGYGKLMERLLMFKDLNEKRDSLALNSSLFSLIIPIAEERLKRFKATVASPVVVLGDASGSMEVAIRTATIISSLLAAICSAKLTFFNQADFACKLDPKNVSDVLNVAYETKASGSTAPAASLVPFFDRKEIVKTFIIVTDEEENNHAYTENGTSWMFFDLFMEYRKEVYPATLIFVSFLHSQHKEGQMYSQFVKENVPDVYQFKFSRSRPDLTKLDSILGKLCSKSSQSFEGMVEKIESEIKTNGVIQTFDALKIDKNKNSSECIQKPVVF